MNFSRLEDDANTHGLFTMGALHEDGQTIVLLGAGKQMWPLFTASREYSDGDGDPLDRWSKRHIGTIAVAQNGEALFPSDGPPYLPFIAWARKTNRFWQSPTGMLIHDVAGLMISVRGAIRVQGVSPLPPVMSVNPCEGCEAPCETACPVSALNASAPYDVPACKAHIATDSGRDCMESGCRVRRICPVSLRFERDPEQSAFHMRSFRGA